MNVSEITTDRLTEIVQNKTARLGWLSYDEQKALAQAELDKRNEIDYPSSTYGNQSPLSVAGATNPCGHGCNKVGIDCDNCAEKPLTEANDKTEQVRKSCENCDSNYFGAGPCPPDCIPSYKYWALKPTPSVKVTEPVEPFNKGVK